MEQVSPDQWQTFYIVGAALITTIILIGNLIKTIKDWRKPTTDMKQKLEEHERYLSSDKARIERLEHDLREINAKNTEAQAVLMKAVLALLNHQLHDGNADEMINAQKALMDYLMR